MKTLDQFLAEGAQVVVLKDNEEATVRLLPVPHATEKDDKGCPLCVFGAPTGIVRQGTVKTKDGKKHDVNISIPSSLVHRIKNAPQKG